MCFNPQPWLWDNTARPIELSRQESTALAGQESKKQSSPPSHPRTASLGSTYGHNALLAPAHIPVLAMTTQAHAPATGCPFQLDWQVIDRASLGVLRGSATITITDLLGGDRETSEATHQP